MQFQVIQAAPRTCRRNAELARHLHDSWIYRKENPLPVQLQRLEAATIHETSPAEVARRMAIRNQKLTEKVDVA